MPPMKQLTMGPPEVGGHDSLSAFEDRMAQMKQVFGNLQAQLRVQPDNSEVKAWMQKLDVVYTRLQTRLAAVLQVESDAMLGLTQE